MTKTSIIPELTAENAPLNLILANGEFPTEQVPLEILRRALDSPSGQVICTDGSVEKLLRFGREPDAVVGDLDSMPQELRQKLAGKLFHYHEQESNDLSKAVRHLHSQENKRTQGLCILGASGGREDHLLGNVSLLPTYAELLGEEVIMLSDHGYFRALRAGTHACQVKIGRQVSFFTLFGGRLSIEGAKWALQDAELGQLWCGTLNQVIDSQLNIRCEAPLIVYFANECKD